MNYVSRNLVVSKDGPNISIIARGALRKDNNIRTDPSAYRSYIKMNISMDNVLRLMHVTAFGKGFKFADEYDFDYNLVVLSYLLLVFPHQFNGLLHGQIWNDILTLVRRLAQNPDGINFAGGAI